MLCLCLLCTTLSLGSPPLPPKRKESFNSELVAPKTGLILNYACICSKINFTSRSKFITMRNSTITNGPRFFSFFFSFFKNICSNLHIWFDARSGRDVAMWPHSRGYMPTHRAHMHRLPEGCRAKWERSTKKLNRSWRPQLLSRRLVDDHLLRRWRRLSTSATVHNLLLQRKVARPVRRRHLESW